MPPLELAQGALWVATTLMELAVIWTLYRQQLYRKIPCFFYYLLLQVVRDVFLAPLSFQHPVLYFYVYWYAEAASGVLGLAVIHEIYTLVLKDYDSLRRLGEVLFRWACVLLVMLTLVVAYTASGSENIPLVATILAMERAARFLQAGLLAFLFMFAKALGLNWRHYVFGIAVGMAIFVASELAVVTMRNHFGRSTDDVFVMLKPATFLCAVSIWFVYLLHPVAAPAKVIPSQGKLSELYRWNQALKGYLQ